MTNKYLILNKGQNSQTREDAHYNKILCNMTFLDIYKSLNSVAKYCTRQGISIAIKDWMSISGFFVMKDFDDILEQCL